MQLTYPPEKYTEKETLQVEEEDDNSTEDEEPVETSLDQKIHTLKKKWRIQKNESRKVRDLGKCR